MRFLARLFAGLTALACLAGAAGSIALVVARHDLIYPFYSNVSAERVTLPGAAVHRLPAADGVEVLSWILPPQDGWPVILFFKGNAGHLPAAARRLRHLVDLGYGIAALNYRGAGGTAGAPSQRALVADALQLYDSLDDELGEEIPPNRRIIYGISLGAALAVQVAAARPSGAVVLGAPFARLCEVGEHHYAPVPVCWLLPDNRWASQDVIDRINAPLLVLHGGKDLVIPISQAEALFEAASEPKTLLRYPDGTHSNLHAYGSREDTAQWLEQIFAR